VNEGKEKKTEREKEKGIPLYRFLLRSVGENLNPSLGFPPSRDQKRGEKGRERRRKKKKRKLFLKSYDCA